MVSLREDAKKRNEMVYDFRAYTFKLGAVPQYMAAVEEVGVPIPSGTVSNWLAGSTATSET